MNIFMMFLYGQKVTDNLNKSYSLSTHLDLEIAQCPRLLHFRMAGVKVQLVNAKKSLKHDSYESYF